MFLNWCKSTVALLSVGTVLVLLSGCGQPSPAEPQASPTAATSEVAAEDAGWWCPEHGMPEEICAQCSTKLAADFQEKGDWCKEHNRPESQCFICHPELEAKFAAQYEAKFGKKPPARTE
jgi:cobalt-zinc-cadmium efflux system membrane fusion protein